MNKNNKILVIDDELSVKDAIKALLLDEGYNVLTAGSGQEGIELAKKELPNLILLDVMMPEINGYETCDILKKEESTKDIPVVFLTAKNTIRDELKGFDSGSLDFITKPFDPADLLKRVKIHFEISENHDIPVSNSDELKILIFESSPVLLRFFTSILTEHNFEVVSSKTSTGAATLSRTKKFDLFILDLLTQESMNGLNVCKYVKIHEKTKEVPIIITTTHVNKEIALRLKQMSIKHVLIKPITREVLLDKVFEIIQKTKDHI